MTTTADKVERKFEEIYGRKPRLFRAPGRVNLIGEHTDYNDGFVLPAAIDKQVVFGIAKNHSNACRLYALDLDESCEFDIERLGRSDKSWANYLIGVADQALKSGKSVGGFDCVFGGDIPLGAGLSSSAAIECGMAYSLNELFELQLDKFTIVKMSQKAENEFVGVSCGIMDQFASVFGQAGKVIKLDCRSLDYEYFDFKMDDLRIVLLDTQVKHSLGSSEYNTRRKECEAGVKLLQKHYPQAKALRDVTEEMLRNHKDELGETIYRRCKYVVEENRRVEEACQALENKDLKTFGEKMYASHRGLSAEYEVSCKELDFLVDQTLDDPAVVGARMMGGGFGGCTINLVKENYISSFAEKMKQAYRDALGLELKVYVDSIAPGVSSIDRP